jgi:hypothetical protein
VMFWHVGRGGLEFWLVGMGLTFIVCLIAGSFMFLVVMAERRRRFKAMRKNQMWEDVLPYDPRKAKAGNPAEAG